MRKSPLIYLDHAATSYPKPPEVVNAVTRAFSARGGNPGRSSHELSRKAAEGVYECRESVCELLGFANPERVIFTQNATHALNIAIKGKIPHGSHTIITNLEHNSVIRPIHSMAMSDGCSYSVINALCDDETLVRNFNRAIQPNTKTAVITLASNVCGKILPTKKLSRICRENGITFIVDGSQAVGCVPQKFDDIGADILCTAGHKGLYGPQGTGFLVVSENIKSISTLIEGGNGVNSEDSKMTDELPERLEVGTQNTPGICGLSAGIKYVLNQGIDSIYESNLTLAKRLSEGLGNIDGVTVYGDCNNRTPVVLFNIRDIPSDKASRIFDRRQICVRSGLHCAPLAHDALKTGKYGAVRASMSFTSTKKDVDEFLKCVNDISLRRIDE